VDGFDEVFFFLFLSLIPHPYLIAMYLEGHIQICKINIR